VEYQETNKSALKSILGADLHTDLPGNGYIEPTEAEIDEIRGHILETINPEIYRAQEPINPAYRDQARAEATAWMRAEGYEIAGDNQPGLF